MANRSAEHGLCEHGYTRSLCDKGCRTSNLVADCRTVLKRCEGAMLGILDSVPNSFTATSILFDIREIIKKIDASPAETEARLPKGYEQLAQRFLSENSGISRNRVLQFAEWLDANAAVDEPCANCERPRSKHIDIYDVCMGFAEKTSPPRERDGVFDDYEGCDRGPKP